GATLRTVKAARTAVHPRRGAVAVTVPAAPGPSGRSGQTTWPARSPGPEPRAGRPRGAARPGRADEAGARAGSAPAADERRGSSAPPPPEPREPRLRSPAGSRSGDAAEFAVMRRAGPEDGGLRSGRGRVILAGKEDIMDSPRTRRAALRRTAPGQSALRQSALRRPALRRPALRLAAALAAVALLAAACTGSEK